MSWLQLLLVWWRIRLTAGFKIFFRFYDWRALLDLKSIGKNNQKEWLPQCTRHVPVILHVPIVGVGVSLSSIFSLEFTDCNHCNDMTCSFYSQARAGLNVRTNKLQKRKNRILTGNFIYPIEFARQRRRASVNAVK